MSLKADANSDGTIVFYQSYSDPETVPWCRIAQWQGRELSTLPAATTPAVMQTSPSCWRRLEAWYRQEHPSCIPPAPPPVQFRTLTELHDMIGVVSHVIATVTSIRRVVVEQPSSISRKRKQQRSSAATAPCYYWLIALQQQQQQQQQQASSSPPARTLLRLEEDAQQQQQPSLLREICQRSLAQQKAIVLLHVVMQQHPTDSASTILVSTGETVGRFATAVDRRILPLPSSSSPLFLTGPSTQDDDEEEATTSSQLLQQQQPTTTTTTLYASIDDIQVNIHQQGAAPAVLSVREQLLQDHSTDAAAAMLLLPPATAASSTQYTFLLRRQTLGDPEAAASRRMVVQVSRHVLEEQLLCGCSPPHDVVFVQDILRGLLTEDIVLRWTVQQEASSCCGDGTTTTSMVGVVQSVVLPEL